MTTIKENLQQALQNHVSEKGVIQFVANLVDWLTKEGFAAVQCTTAMYMTCSAEYKGFKVKIEIAFLKKNGNFIDRNGTETGALHEIKVVFRDCTQDSAISTKVWVISEYTQLIVVIDDIKKYIWAIVNGEIEWD